VFVQISATTASGTADNGSCAATRQTSNQRTTSVKGAARRPTLWLMEH
jgi:hypothetical protein